MKIFNAVVFMTAVFFFSACSKNDDTAFKNLKNSLTGSWKSEGNVEIYFDWEKKNDEMLGKSYSLTGKDTLFLKKYRLYHKNDTLFMQMAEYNNEQEVNLFSLYKSFFGKYTFKAKDDIYPFYVIFDLKVDGWEYVQTNTRGNKKIGFYFITN